MVGLGLVMNAVGTLDIGVMMNTVGVGVFQLDGACVPDFRRVANASAAKACNANLRSLVTIASLVCDI